nr:immunoglobulin heavy chain junction region [Macaca mulatta]MOV87965.1 immunoglobulin heavy chain junction region [Macaca mulatta]MOV88283.1 immunoglobulin heavy chain junction region [Macaca mulatta]MOV89185.1 immunoglobulin heavy chain junction region [Macaca mulatta]MOV89327.1 immunoglobulin heavy chain junction region [Macaca mulatta]
CARDTYGSGFDYW